MQNPFDPGYYCSEELRLMGFAAVGENVRIAKNCTIIGLGNIRIGNNVRIDANTHIIATGRIVFGSYIHVGGHCHLVGRGGLILQDFSGLSQGVRLYSASDDYSGAALTNPMVPEEFTKVRAAPILLDRHAIIGAGSVVLPGVSIGIGAAVGALSLLTRDVPPWVVVAGAPARKVSERQKGVLQQEAGFSARLWGEAEHHVAA